MERSYFERLPKDLILKLALELDLPSVLSYCRSSKKFNNLICDNYIFWINRHLKDFKWKYTGDKTLAAIKESYKELSYWWNPKNQKGLTDKLILKTPGLKNLTTLNAIDNPKITDESVKQLQNLTTLSASDNPKITDRLSLIHI